MDVLAYNAAVSGQQPLALGAIAQQIWVNGFKFGEDRQVQVFTPFRGAVPILFDRLTRTESFHLAAGRSFGTAATALDQALDFIRTHVAAVPVLANLVFSSPNKKIYLLNCGIPRVELLEKRGALLIFSYTITGGTFSAAPPQNL
jgi:hypothetical protein